MKEATPLERVDPVHLQQRGKRLLDFGGCDYLRLARSPALQRALLRAIKQYGWNVAASRLTTGNHPLYRRAEHLLARFFGAEAALLLPTGYSAPVAAAQAVTGQFTHALVDEASHVSLHDAARFLECAVWTFPHRDVRAVARLVQRAGLHARLILLTDGVFGWNGSVAPLADYKRVLPPTAWIMVDDAHAVGILGRRGRGTLEWHGLPRRNTIQTLTLSKALGLYGGLILGTSALRQKIIQRSACFGGGTPLPLPFVAAIETALSELQRMLPTRDTALRHAARVRTALRNHGWEVLETPTPIVAIFPKTPHQARRLCRCLSAASIHPTWTEYPGRPAGYLRLVFTPAHRPTDIDRLLKALLPSIRSPRNP